MAIVAICVALAGCGTTRSTSAGARRPSAATGVKSAAATGVKYVGIFAANLPSSYSPAISFSQATGARVNIAGYYSGWPEPFQVGFAETAWKHGATTLVDMDPHNGAATITGVADGRYDAYLRSFAKAVAGFGHPVIVSFAHEMNASWYQYGYKYVTPSVFIAAYRRVHDIFSATGARNVTWMWAVNRPAAGQTSPSVAEWYPGNAYVDWVGIDGYDWSGSLTFTQAFGATLAQVRSFTNRPVLIAETSVLPGANAAAQVTSWFQGIVSNHLLGLVWFDIDKASRKGIADDHDWKLENDQPALAAFRAAIQEYDVASPRRVRA